VTYSSDNITSATKNVTFYW